MSQARARIPKSASLAFWAFVVLALAAGSAAAQAPGIDWQRSDWFPVHPTDGNQAAAASGEDWWYDHDNSYDGSHALQGYIAAGFSTFVNWAPSELPFGGCFESSLDAPKCEHFESAGNVRGEIATTMALVDREGQKRIWIRKYSVGYFTRVIQTSDGGYLAVGTSPSTVDLEGERIFYNPGQTPGELTDFFGPGNGCSAGDGGKYRVVAVKVDKLGQKEWQYSYGMEPYRDQNGNPQAATAYGASGSAWDVIETPSGNFLIVGDTYDSHHSYFCGSGAPNALSRGFLIEVDKLGHWVSGNFFGPVDAPSTVDAIALLRTPAGDRYVLASNELFPTTAVNPFTGCGLYQKVTVRCVDAAPGHPELWQRTNFDIASPADENQSQRTDGIEVNASGVILLPLIEKCTGCLYASTNRGLAKVFQLDAAGQILGSSDVGPVLAFDLKHDLTVTADGGFATVSTHQDQVPEAESCYQTSYWQTDALVSKFDANGALEWSTTFDSPNPQAEYPGDEKKQECLYSISQSSDGGLVVSGNESSNFDDDYLAKLEPPPLPPGPALTIRDTQLDAGLEPNPDTGPMWVSEDIWVRNLDDHGLAHQNPEYSQAQLDNFVQVRVTNLGSAPASGTLKVYWAKAATGLGWPTQWMSHAVAGVLWGDQLPDTKSIVALAPGATTIFSFPWKVPNPADFLVFGAEKGHFCLLARIEPVGGNPETSDVYGNVRDHRGIAWKNVSIVEGPMKEGSVVVRNTSAVAADIRLELADLPVFPGRPASFLEYGTIDVELGTELTERWVAGGRQGQGFEVLPDGCLRLRSANAWIGGLRMEPEERQPISVDFHFNRTAPRADFRFDILQYVSEASGNVLVGGERFLVPAPAACNIDPGLIQAGITFARPAILAQTFQPLLDGRLTQVVHGLRLAPSSAPSYNLYLTTTRNGRPSWPSGVLYKAIGLTTFASGTGIDAVVPISADLQLSNDETYALVLEPAGPGDMYWRGNSGAGTYPRGAAFEWNPAVKGSWALTTVGPKDHGFHLDGVCN